MASLQARHSRSCALERSWTPFAAATPENGCTCSPLYYVVHQHEHKLIRDPVGYDRKEAETSLKERQVGVERKTYRTVENLKFAAWADQWLAGHQAKENSLRVYKTTLEYAKQTFGKRSVRDLKPTDVERFLKKIRDENHRAADKDSPGRDVSPATLAKHLRQLSACLEDAVRAGYALSNPVKMLPKASRPKLPESQASYFTDAELSRLWPELAKQPVMLALCKTAVGTGMRFGELAALKWSDVELVNREVRVSRTYVEGIGETAPKNNKTRTVDLTPPAAAVLETWFSETADKGDGDLVFPRWDGEHIPPSHITRNVLYPALERAGIPRVGERGNKRDFHSLRHTFARKALEGGAEIVWVQSQLGHSSITLTVDTYGHWARTAQKAQAERLADAFAL